MNISNSLRYALGVSATAAMLASCSSNESPSTFVPSGATTQTIAQAGPNARARGGVTTYSLVKLVSLGGKASIAQDINNRGWVAGQSNLRGNKIVHAALWRAGSITDLGTLGGPNSEVVWYNHNTYGKIAGVSQVSQAPPYGEDFCSADGLDTSHICLGFTWQNDVMTALPTLGGPNAQADDVNNRGHVVGTAETNTQDPSCDAPQVFDYYGVIWRPNGKTVVLPPYSGDSVSSAEAINDSGQVVGTSGPCYGLQSDQASVHALLWQRGSTTNLGNLGGTTSNEAYDINKRGQIVGYSYLADNTTFHAFLWQQGVMSDLGTLPGDVFSEASGINDKGQVVGESCPASGDCRGFIWQNGSMTDLNLLIRKSKLYLLFGSDINNRGQIAATTFNIKSSRTVAVELLPNSKPTIPFADASAPKVTLPESLRMQLRNPRVGRRLLATL